MKSQKFFRKNYPILNISMYYEANGKTEEELSLGPQTNLKDIALPKDLKILTLSFSTPNFVNGTNLADAIFQFAPSRIKDVAIYRILCSNLNLYELENANYYALSTNPIKTLPIKGFYQLQEDALNMYFDFVYRGHNPVILSSTLLVKKDYLFLLKAILSFLQQKDLYFIADKYGIIIDQF